MSLRSDYEKINFGGIVFEDNFIAVSVTMRRSFMEINYNPETNLSEYKIENTTYVVTMKFNKSGENLEDIISHLIARDIEEAA